MSGEIELFRSQGLIHSTNVLNIYYVPGIFLIVKDGEILRQRGHAHQDHGFNDQTCNPIRAQSGK